MKALVLAEDKKPAEFQGRCCYLIYGNSAPISVGDVISVSCNRHLSAKVLRIWHTLTARGPHIPLVETEYGHKHFIELDRPLGSVTSDKEIRLIRRNFGP